MTAGKGAGGTEDGLWVPWDREMGQGVVWRGRGAGKGAVGSWRTGGGGR